MSQAQYFISRRGTAGAVPKHIARRRIKPFIETLWNRSFAIVCLAFVLMSVNNGFIIAGLTSFDNSILGDLGLSFGSLKFRDTVTIACLGISIPFVGVLLDRVPVRPIIVLGLLMMAGGFGAYRYVQTPWQMYAAQILLGASQAFCGLVAHVVLISRWTSIHRGLALGFVVAGSSLGNAVAPSFNGYLLAHFVWRDAILFGSVIAVMLIPAVYVIYREGPALNSSEIGTMSLPDLTSAGIDTLEQGGNRRTFWLLGSAAATSVICVLGLATNLSLYVSHDLRGSAGFAQWLLFTLFFGSCVAQIVAGLAADRLGSLAIHRLALSLMFLGMLGIVIAPAAWLSASVAVFGVGWGGNSAMLQVQPVALFPSSILGRTLGMLAVMETIGGAIAPALVGFGRDLSGSYHYSFIGLTAVAVLAAGCVGAIRRGRSVL